MNVISGLFKGKVLKSPLDSKTHPMGSREKLALFNMILSYLPSSVVLDAFAGSGALGIESLSHGAKKVVFLEKSPKIAKTIKENLKSLPSGNYETEVVVSSVSNFVSGELFDIILADPPYDAFDASEVANLTKYLKTGGIFVLSSPKFEPIPDFSGLNLEKSHTYAAASISLYKKF